MPVEQISPELERIVSQGQETEELGSGFGGTGKNAEGPLWWKEGAYLLFSHVGNDRRMKWAPGEGVSLFGEPTNNANGLTRDPQSRLIACETSSSRVTRLETDGSITIVADSHESRPLNRPNDVVVKSDGSMYFTAPGALNPESDLEVVGVYRVSPDLSTTTLVTRALAFPNGLTFSTDERTLYIDDSRRGNILAFDVGPDGTLANERVFCDLRGERPGVPDGMKVDVEGNVYCTGPGGVWIIDPAGRHLGTILTGSGQTTNCAWGGDDWKTLYITTRETLSKIQLKIAGIPVPSVGPGSK